jgi:hypothetical protein
MYGDDLDIDLDVLVQRQISGARPTLERDGLSSDNVLASVLRGLLPSESL